MKNENTGYQSRILCDINRREVIAKKYLKNFAIHRMYEFFYYNFTFICYVTLIILFWVSSQRAKSNIRIFYWRAVNHPKDISAIAHFQNSADRNFTISIFLSFFTKIARKDKVWREYGGHRVSLTACVGYGEFIANCFYFASSLFVIFIRYRCDLRITNAPIGILSDARVSAKVSEIISRILIAAVKFSWATYQMKFKDKTVLYS